MGETGDLEIRHVTFVRADQEQVLTPSPPPKVWMPGLPMALKLIPGQEERSAFAGGIGVQIG
jgi:hypothetical protein